MEALSRVVAHAADRLHTSGHRWQATRDRLVERLQSARGPDDNLALADIVEQAVPVLRAAAAEYTEHQAEYYAARRAWRRMRGVDEDHGD